MCLLQFPAEELLEFFNCRRLRFKLHASLHITHHFIHAGLRSVIESPAVRMNAVGNGIYLLCTKHCRRKITGRIRSNKQRYLAAVRSGGTELHFYKIPVSGSDHFGSRQVCHNHVLQLSSGNRFYQVSVKPAPAVKLSVFTSGICRKNDYGHMVIKTVELLPYMLHAFDTIHPRHKMIH